MIAEPWVVLIHFLLGQASMSLSVSSLDLDEPHVDRMIPADRTITLGNKVPIE